MMLHGAIDYPDYLMVLHEHVSTKLNVICRADIQQTRNMGGSVIASSMYSTVQ